MSMKIKFLVLLLLSSLGTYAQQIQWMSLSEALEAQKKEPKKIIMDVYTKWCGPCKLLDKKTFANPDLARYVSEHFYAVKFNAAGCPFTPICSKGWLGAILVIEAKVNMEPKEFTIFIFFICIPSL